MAASRAQTMEPPTKTASHTATRSSKRKAPAVSRTTPEPVAPDPVLDVSPDRIAERAYYIWLRKGRPVGQDHQNWIEAEQELRRELSAA